MIRIATFIAGTALLSACAPVERDEDFVSEAPAATIVGEAERCIDPARITRTTVHDDRTIDFRVGSKTYRNTLPRRCARLGFERAISYDVRGSSLCTPEFIFVLDGTGGNIQRGAPCALGEFVPIEIVEEEPESR